MLKTISGALLAVSVIAAPALAASSTDKAPATKTTQAPAAKTTQAKPSALNANAKMGHHQKHVRHHRSPKKMSALSQKHKFSKITNKHVAPVTKRG